MDRPDYKGWAMVIRNIHQDRTNVGYIVGTVSDHVLNVNGEDVSLRDLCGKTRLCVLITNSGSSERTDALK